MKTALTLTALATALSLTAVAAPAAKPERHVKQADVSWVQPFGPKGPSFGFVEGAFNDKHPASFFIKMTAVIAALALAPSGLFGGRTKARV